MNFYNFAASCSDALSGCRIKRESGENPEQTRCCKPIWSCPFFCHCIKSGKADSQGKSEDLQDAYVL